MLSTVLIIDKRKELSTKYKKSIEDEQTEVIIAKTLKDAIMYVQNSEPDLLIISDSLDEDLSDFCKKIRSLTYNTRPAIVALSKSADSGDRIKVLENGADDFLSEPVNIEEFKTRIRAHLRRDIELNLDIRTMLPNKKYVYKAIKRCLTSPNKYSILLMGIENLDSYKSVYSDVAGDKLIQTLIAITKSSLENNDFLGQIDEKTFVIITSPISAEKMSAFLTFAFDTVAPKFYSAQDAKRGYTLLKGEREAEMRADFVSIYIGGVIDNYDISATVEALLERLYSLKNIAKNTNKSNYAIDRIKLSGENSIVEQKNDKSVCIMEPDEALSLLLRTSLELQGYTVINEDSGSIPSIIILDSGDDMSGLKICKNIRENSNSGNVKIIVTTTTRDKSTVLDAGADLYLPKPYELTDLIGWIEYFLRK